MGNCQCKPREGGESVRGFLARKFHKLSGKRKIDDLVTMAIQYDGEINGIQKGADETGQADEIDDHLVDMELVDLEYETDSEYKYCPDSDSRTSSNYKPLDKCQINDDLNENTENDCYEKPSSQDVFDDKNENDYIKVLQQQLQQVQSELANLQRDASTGVQNRVIGIHQNESYSACSIQSQQSDAMKAMPGELRCEIDSPIEPISNRSHRSTFLHAQGDTRVNPVIHLKDKHTGRVSAASEKERARARMVQIRDKGDTERADDILIQKDGRRSKMRGMITEGLRTRTDVKPARNKVQVTRKEKAPNTKIVKDYNAVEDENRIAAKLATLQKRDPKLPGPDKGIVWPKTMDNLSKVDKAYYVEQFLRSELFRQRCLRKYQGSKTWMNGLTSFHLWVLENEDTAEMEAILHPLPKRQNNAQAKVRCWRGTTPPPPPKSP